MKKEWLVLLICFFIVMTGFGITLPVLPFHAERLALARGTSRQALLLHVGLLTSLYALMQFVFAPVWGRWSDVIGRKPLILIGVAGLAAGQVLFGVSTSLWMLCGSRAIAGALSSAAFPAAQAYIADTTTEDERKRGMGWLGASVSLGFVLGPALGGVLARRDLNVSFNYGPFLVDSFSLPFFTSAALALLTLLLAVWLLPETLRHMAVQGAEKAEVRNRGELNRMLRPFLGLTMLVQLGIAMFETTFALYAQQVLGYGPASVGVGFMVCGLVMAVLQAVLVGNLWTKIREDYLIAAGSALMGVGLILLLTARNQVLVMVFIALFGVGIAVVLPSLSALISKSGGKSTGRALGMQSAANSLGQTAGPLLGGMLFAWNAGLPYLIDGILLMGIGLIILRKRKEDCPHRN